MYIVSYDISDPKRLHTVHKTLKGYGDPLHYSVFRCHLSSKGKVELVAALTSIINHNDDRVILIHLGPLEGEADKRIEYLGIHPKVNDQSVIIS